jgi:hypothetical protein
MMNTYPVARQMQPSPDFFATRLACPKRAKVIIKETLICGMQWLMRLL